MADDFSADPATTGALVLDGALTTGRVDFSGDVDWFAVTLTAGDAVLVTGADWLAGIQFYDALGNPVAVDTLHVLDANAHTQSASFTATTTGTYYVAAIGGTTLGDYALTATTHTPGDAHDVGLFPVAPNNGSISSLYGQVKWSQVHLTAGQTLYLQTPFRDGDGPTLLLYDAFGAPVAGHSSAVFTGDTGVLFTATQTGTY